VPGIEFAERVHTRIPGRWRCTAPSQGTANTISRRGRVWYGDSTIPSMAAGTTTNCMTLGKPVSQQVPIICYMHAAHSEGEVPVLVAEPLEPSEAIDSLAEEEEEI